MDRAYENGAYIPGGDGYVARWTAEASAFRAAAAGRARLDQPYGPGPRRAMDVFLPDAPPRGIVIFVHGGYWHRFGREVWSHLAAGSLERGWAVAMPSYTLAPAARIADMTQEIAAAISAAAGICDGPMVVTGHSAGGHLAARMACADAPLPAEVAGRILRVLPISPLADLAPLMASAMNATLGIDAAEAAAESPARLPLRPGVAVTVWVGGQERPAFLWQARLLSEVWACPWHVDPGRHHFDVIEGLCSAHSDLTRALLDGL